MTENNEIMVKTDTLPIIPEYDCCDDAIAAMPIVLPYLKIGQKDESAGKIIDNSGTEMDLSEVIIVKMSTSRVKWQKPYDQSIKYPLCRSFDNKVPDIKLFLSGNAEGRPPSDNCKDCPFSQEKDENGDWKRADCDLQINIWGLDMINSVPFVLTLSGMSLSTKSQTSGYKTVKQWISQMKLRRQPFYMVKTEIMVGKFKGQKGSAYTALFRIWGQSSQDELEDISEIIREMSEMGTNDLEKAEANGVEDSE